MTVDELIRVLDPCPDLLLIDCFGTLLHRRVPMRRVRRIVSENLLTELDTALGPDLLDRTRREVELEWGRANAAAGGARDHRLEELAAELHDRLGIQIERDRFVRRFCEIEVEAEVRLTRRNAPIVRAIEASIPPERVCVVSDTNLTERMLRDLLEARRAMCPTWRVVTSCDAGATKRSGELYQRLTVDREPGARWVMVGDNAQADGEQARASAIEPLLVAPGRWDATRDVSWRVVRRDVTRQVARVLQPVGSGDVFPELALTLFVFADRLDQSMRQLESSRAVFLAREGAFLKTLFDVAQEEYATRSRPALASAYLLTSRKSTFVPSLDHLEAGLTAFVRARPTMTTQDLMSTLGLEDWEHAVGSADRMASSVLPSLFGNPRMRAELTLRGREQRELLAAIVERAAPDTATVDVVDVGWRGTVRSQLSRAIPDRAFRAHLLGLVTRSEVPATRGVLFENWPRRTPYFQVLSHFKELYELLLAAGHGSVDHYTRGADGSPAAVFDDDRAERARFESLIGPFQDRCLMRFRALLDVLAAESARSSRLEELMIRHHARMMYRPTTSELDFVARLGQRENFGASATRTALDTAPVEGSVGGLRRYVAGGGWPPLRMRLAGASWQRVPYALYKDGQRRTGRLR